MAKSILSAILLLGAVFGGPIVKKGPCDETRECIRHSFTGADRMLCFGYYGCKGATMDSSRKAVCAGAKACTRAKFTTNVEEILCNGYASCQRGRSMTNSNKISCNGLKACTDIVGGLTAPKILCDGDITCTNFKSKKNSALALNLNAEGFGDASMLYCNGNGACRETQQRSEGMIYCDGDGACKESRMQAKEIECQGKRACKDTIMQPSVGGPDFDSLQCQGWFGCAGAEVIMAKNVLAYGFNALAGATIETRGMPEFNLKAYGFRALAGATIDCKGSTCNIDCKGNACKNTPITVAKSSTLNLKPAGCDPKNAGCEVAKKAGALTCAKTKGVNCPYVMYARAEQTEEELAAWRQSVVAEYQESEEYQEYLEMEDIAEQESEAYITDRLRDYEMLNEYDEEEGDDEFFAADTQSLFAILQ